MNLSNTAMDSRGHPYHPRASQNTCVVIFHRDEFRLREPESSGLERWLADWPEAAPGRHVVIGCCPDTAREARQRRLEHLRSHLIRCGVPVTRIRFSRECSEQAPRADAADVPVDVFWLSLVA